MPRFLLKSDTIADATTKNRILLKDEPYLVYHADRIELWIGLDGVTAFNSLPATQLVSSGEVGGETGLVHPIKLYDPVEEEYVTATSPVTTFIGEVDPGPAGLNIMSENDIYRKITPLASPSSLSASIVSVNTVRLTWQDNTDDEDGFVIEKSSAYVDWTLDVSDGATLTVGTKIYKDGVLYTVETEHSVGTPKTFDVSKYSVAVLTFSTVHTTAADAETYDVTGNAYDTRYMFRVTTKKGDVYSTNNPTVTAKTQSNATTQTDRIAALTGLWIFTKMYDSAAPLADASGNSRTMTLLGSATFQQAALETTDTGDYSILVQQGGNGFYRNTIWTYGSASWEMGGIFMVPNPWGIPGNAPFFGIFKTGSSNSKVRIWTDSTSTKFQIQTVTDGGVWTGATSTFTFAKDIVYFITMAYDHTNTTIYCWVDNTMVVSLVKDLSTGFTLDSMGWAHDGGSNLNLRMQKCFVKAGAMLTTQERSDIYNAGTYIS